MEYPHALNVQDGKLILDSLGTLKHSNRIFLRSFTQSNKFDIGGADLTQSTGEIYYQGWNGLRDTIPAINMPLGMIAITGRAENAPDTIFITGDLSSTYLAARNDGTKSLELFWSPKTYTFTSKTDGLFLNGNSDAVSPVISNFGSGTFDLGFFGGTPSIPNNKAQVFRYQNGQFIVSGNIRIQPNTTTDGGGVWTIDSTAFIKLSGTSIGDLDIDAGAGRLVVDSGTVRVADYTVASGNVHINDTTRVDDAVFNNDAAGDSVVLAKPLYVSGTFSCAAGVKFAYSGEGKIILSDCTPTLNGNATVESGIVYIGCTGGRRGSAKKIYKMYE